MTIAAKAKTRFFEGGNVTAFLVIPALFVGTVCFYGWVVAAVKPLQIDVADVYSYVFNLYAIELGSVLAIFALFACRPTPFLERIKSTATFSAIVANTNITLVLIVITLMATFALGVVKMWPHDTLDLNSIVFLGWCGLTIMTSAVCVRTVRLMLTALS